MELSLISLIFLLQSVFHIMSLEETIVSTLIKLFSQQFSLSRQITVCINFVLLDFFSQLKSAI